MKRICIINCWFGPYHNYFGLWMKSVAWNPTIDFLIVGDTPLPDGAPSNLRHLPMTLEELEAKIRRRLGNEKAILPSPYKCCDYKAMYGTIFGEELSGYDFWGHCDIDLVFGDLRDFLTEERLSRYDKIYPNGHLSVFRNNQEVNERWRLPYAKFDVEQVIASPMNFAFDEWDGIYNIYIRLGLPFLRDVEFLNLAPGTRRFRFRRRTNAKYERPPENHDHSVSTGRMARSTAHSSMQTARCRSRIMHISTSSRESSAHLTRRHWTIQLRFTARPGDLP